MFSGGGPCLSPSSSVTPVWLFPRESFRLPACLLLRAGKQIFLPDQSCLFLMWHVCLPSSVAVLPEGLPAASLSVRSVGVQGAPAARACSSSIMGFSEELDSSLRLRKPLKKKKETFLHLDEWPSCLDTGPEKTSLNPSI